MTLEPSFYPILFFPTLGVSPSHQGEEQEVQLYYKMFSSTRHGFLGAGVVSQPLSHVWAAVSDPTLWPLYHKPIQTARLRAPPTVPGAPRHACRGQDPAFPGWKLSTKCHETSFSRGERPFSVCSDHLWRP